MQNSYLQKCTRAAKLNYKSGQIYNFLGFTSFVDFFESMFRLKHWSINATFAFAGLMTSFITGYVWDTASAVWTLWALMLADWITGIWKSMKNKNFNSYKLFRMPLYFLATSFLLSISWWMGKGSSLFFFLPSITMAGFYSVYFTSLLENIGELGFLPKTLVSLLRKRFGLKTLVEKYSSNDTEKL